MYEKLQSIVAKKQDFLHDKLDPIYLLQHYKHLKVWKETFAITTCM